MAVTRIKNNQITDLTVNAAAKLQDYSITSGKIANNLTYASDLTISGNLLVTGNVTTIDTIDLVVEDPIILLAKNQTGTPTVDIGFIGKRGTSDNIAFVWDESSSEFVTVYTNSETTNTLVTINSYANFRTANISAVNANITGTTTIANVAIGNIVGNLTVTGNVSGGNLLTSGIVSATGTVTGGNVSTAGFVTATGNVTGGNVNTAGLVTATGNVTGGNVNTAGAVSATGNINGGNLNAVFGVTASTGYFTGNVDVLGNLNATIGVVYANSGIFYGNATTGDNAAYAGVPGFTQLGSDVVMQFGGNVNSYSQLNFQNINNGTRASTDFILTTNTGDDFQGFINMGITGSNWDGSQPNSLGNALYGGDGYFYTDAGNLLIGTTDATDVVRVVSGGTGAQAIVATFNAAGTASTNTTSGALIINGGIGANGNINGANIATPGTLSSTGNVTSGNVNTAGLVSAGGNVTGGNINTAGVVTATGNVTGGNLNTSGNVTGLNVLSSGIVSAAGNITGGNLSIPGAAAVGTLSTTGDALIAGNLTIQGNLTYINIEDLRVEDPILQLGTGANGNVLITNDGKDRGTQLVYYSTVNSQQQNAFFGWDNSSGNMLAASNVTVSGEIVTVVNYGTFEAGAGYFQSASVVGNIVGGNISTAGTFGAASISASGNVTGGNLNTTGVVSATGTVTGGNVSTAGFVTATGNVTGGNLNTAGLASVGGNVIGGNINTAGVVSATGTVTGGNVSTAGFVTATGNIDGGNLNTAGLVTATGNVTGGNINTAGVVTATGNVTGGNISTAGLITATGTVTGGNLVTGGNANLGNIRISGDTITGVNGQVLINSAMADVNFIVSGDTIANLLVADAGSDTVIIGSGTPVTNAALNISTTNSMIVPVGTVSQRPATGVTGMLRFNTTSDQLEYFDSDSWTSAGTTFTVISDNQFTGDDVTTTFTLSTSSTTAATIVSINGVMQIPTTAYSVSGTSLVFTEAPASTDVIDARCLTTTTTIIGLQNNPGNASIEGSGTSSAFNITGNLIPTANVTYDLGSSSMRWRDGWFAGTSIHLGNVVIKNTSGNTIAFYGPDGSTPATIDSTNIDTTSITNGTSSVAVISSGGNVRANVGGATVGTFYSGGLSVPGIINSGANGVGNIGSATGYFNTVFAKATSAQYADLAEMYAADQIIEPGTVVCFGGENEVTICDSDACRRIAGVVSTNPSYLMNSGLDCEYPTAVALQGRVPVKVTGVVRKGDMMVAAANGFARAEANPQIGSVIGKALADFNGTDGIIEVVIGRL